MCRRKIVGGRVSEAYWNQSNQVNGRRKRRRRRAQRHVRVRATSGLVGGTSPRRNKYKPKPQPQGRGKRLRYQRRTSPQSDADAPTHEQAMLTV